MDKSSTRGKAYQAGAYASKWQARCKERIRSVTFSQPSALKICGGGSIDATLPHAQARLESLLPLCVRLSCAKGDGSCFIRCIAQASPDDTTRNAWSLQNLSALLEHPLGVDAAEDTILRASEKLRVCFEFIPVVIEDSAAFAAGEPTVAW
eukprot:3567720-Amphidinium_carterae.2